MDARVYWGREHERAWDELEAQRRLTIKAVLSMWIYPEQTDDNAQIARLKTFYKRGVEVKITEAYPIESAKLFFSDPNSRLRRNQVKMYMDGLLNTRTALVLEKYRLNTPDLGIGQNGVRYFQQDRLTKYLNGLQVRAQCRRATYALVNNDLSELR